MKAHLTAIARNKPSVPMRRLHKNDRLHGSNMLDYGCGRGKDAEAFNMTKYDPHYFNDVSVMQLGQYDIITCNYVLNVIESPIERQRVLDDIRLMLRKGGLAYITVRRDIKTEGYTKRGTYQENITLNLPILWENSSYCTYVLSY
jgi:2-polyprenyl-3-methyl-5-hydroxy-6-metoxy-1,4-benzoquinol methylase